MAFQAVPDAAEIVVQYVGNGTTQHNVLHALKPGGYSAADLLALAVAADAVVASDWLPLQTADHSYVSTTVRGLAFLNDLETTVTAGAGLGQVASGGLPGNVTIAIQKQSGLTGRNARGRLYWIGLPEIQLRSNENEVIATDAVAIVDAVDAMRLAVAATIWTPVIVSRFLNNVKRAQGVTFTWTQTTKVDDDVDSMRPRLK